MYAGAIGEVQGLETLVSAANMLRARSDIHIAVVGTGAALPKLKHLVTKLRLENITFFPARPLEEMGRVLNSADAQLICLRDLPLYRITPPSKIQATLAAGRPMIVSSGGDAGRVVEAAGAGASCPAGDAPAHCCRSRAALRRAVRKPTR